MQQFIERFKNLSSAQQLAIGGSAAVLLILLITAVAVAGGGDEPVAVTSTTTSTTVPTESTTTSTTPESTTTTTEPAPVGDTWPLTGIVDPEAVPTSPILVAKIDNSSSSRPQTGLGQADMVVEVLVEGGVARFLAFYQSTIPDEIGPIRSTREVDPRLIAPFDVVFAYSGGIPANVEAVRQVATDAGHPSLGSAAYSRDPSRPAPYDLMLNPAAALDLAGPTSGDIWFRFEEEPPVGDRALTVEVALSPIMDLTYRWSSIDQGFLRFHGETAHVDDTGEQIVASNVVVLAVEQFDSGRTDGAGNPVPDYQVTGTGTAFVFRDGVAITGTWERGSQDGFFRLLDEAGQPISLAPGNVWIELMPTGRAVGWQ